MPILSKFFASLRKIFKGKPRKQKSVSRRSRTSRAPSKKARIKKNISRKTGRKPARTVRSVPKTKKKMTPKAKNKPLGVSGKKIKKGVAPGVRLPHNKHKGKAPHAASISGEEIGEITHFFSRIQVVVVKMNKGVLRVGETVQVKGKKTDFTQKVRSMQVESVDVKAARKGQLIGLKVEKPADVGDKVCRCP